MAKAESTSLGSNVATISVDHPHPSVPSSSASVISNGTVMISSGDSARFSSPADSAIVSSEFSNSDRLSDNSRIPEDHSTKFTRFMDLFFRNVGYIITDHAKLVLTIVLIFTLFTSIKVPFTKQEDDLKTGYTPHGARSHQEVAMHEEFYSKNGSDPVQVVLFIVAKDNGTLTRSHHLNETVKVLDHIGHNFFMPNHGNTSNGQSFYEFCTDFCEFNEPLRHFRNGFVIQSNPDYALLQPNDLFDSRINLSFPFMSVLGRELDLSPLFFGVRKFPNDDAQRHAHLTTNIEHLPLIVLQYRADKPKYATKEDVQAWERTIERYFHL
uniref:Uncharacterized protein n=1 Tax=Panagrolaimus superbus TaxID=310955 RepID=A0A914YAY8_9BILA